jgi:hypothetical protein
MEEERETVRVLSRLKSETGDEIGSVLDLPVDVTVDKLQLICNALLKQVSFRCIIATQFTEMLYLVLLV